MRIQNGIISASEGKYLARKSSQDFTFTQCFLLKGETKDDFVELTQEEVDAINDKFRRRFKQTEPDED